MSAAPLPSREYTHELGNRVEFISGWYALESEGLIEVNGRQVLYALGTSVVDSSCCGIWGCQYGLVLGYVRKYKGRKNAQGMWVSDIEPIEDEEIRRTITAELNQRELITMVQFY